MKQNIGIIGAGNMGSAIALGILNAKLVASQNVFICDHQKKKLEKLKEKYAVSISPHPQGVLDQSEIVILAVKPNSYKEILKEVTFREDTILVSIVAGQDLQTIEKLVKGTKKIVRAMPNTPALVSEGMTALCATKEVGEKELETIQTIFSSFGKCEIVKEEWMDAVTAISGSSPAYVYMFIEALADAAVMEGLPREQAYTFASQAVLGVAKMVLTTKEHPGKLKDQVCSPAGTTIAAVAVLEKEGFRGSIMKAVKKCAKKSKNLSK